MDSNRGGPPFKEQMAEQRMTIRAQKISRKLAARVGPMAIDSSKEILPLQAADMLAYAAVIAGRNLVAGKESVTRPELNPLVMKIRYQQFIWWDGTKQEMRQHRGRWIQIDPSTIRVAPEFQTPEFAKMVKATAQMMKEKKR